MCSLSLCSEEAELRVVPGDTVDTMIVELCPFTNYTVSVFANTSEGAGPAESTVFTTLEAGEWAYSLYSELVLETGEWAVLTVQWWGSVLEAGEWAVLTEQCWRLVSGQYSLYSGRVVYWRLVSGAVLTVQW